MLDVGSTIGDYRLERRIGRGGMGVVFRATQLSLGRPVALKVIAPEIAQDPAFRERFKREARHAAHIDHPNIVPIYQADEHEGHLYIAMRYVPGTDLRDYSILRGQLDPPDAVRIVEQVAAALDAAHEQGFVHRDVKPANVLLTGKPGSEHVYLTDFGLTKHLSSSVSLTRTGAVLGTLDYIAPEQLRGGPIDGRADVYALGCVLYELLTARVPFDRDSDEAKLFAHFSEPPPRPSAVVGAPAGFDDVVLRAMEKDPDSRYATAGELATAARGAISGDSAAEAPTRASPPPAPPAPPASPASPARKRSPTPEPEESPGSSQAADAHTAALPSRSRRPPGRRLAALVAVCVAGAAAVAIIALTSGGGQAETEAGGLPEAPDCPVLPASNHFNRRVDALPVAANSATLISSIGRDETVHPDFGSGTYDGGPIGIPYTVVGKDQKKVPVSFEYEDESDAGPYPIPPSPKIEGGPNSDSDRHLLIVDRDSCRLYELFAARPADGGARWTAAAGATFDLRSNSLRRTGWTSADGAGLPILPGLARYDEVAKGEIGHALRFTAPRTRRAFVYPARHYASEDNDAALPPMGTRVRLKANTDISILGEQAQVVARALKTYGALLADNGSPWFFTGSPDSRWDNADLRTLNQLKGSDFEVVDTSGLPKPR